MNIQDIWCHDRRRPTFGALVSSALDGHVCQQHAIHGGAAIARSRLDMATCEPPALHLRDVQDPYGAWRTHKAHVTASRCDLDCSYGLALAFASVLIHPRKSTDRRLEVGHGGVAQSAVCAARGVVSGSAYRLDRDAIHLGDDSLHELYECTGS
jgi:hypothetical protein